MKKLNIIIFISIVVIVVLFNKFNYSRIEKSLEGSYNIYDTLTDIKDEGNFLEEIKIIKKNNYREYAVELLGEEIVEIKVNNKNVVKLDSMNTKGKITDSVPLMIVWDDGKYWKKISILDS